MSLVGTRPPTVDEWDKYELHHRARLATKPGLTGMWQVSGRSNITDFEEVVKLDKQYISEYIKSTIDYFYEYNRTGLKLSPVYMDGKGNYKQKEKEVKSLISQYSKASKGNKSKVIYCFDCDEYDNKIEDLTFLKTVKKYCDDRGYDFIWFCKDVEQVYIGKRVDNSKKRMSQRNLRKII